MTPDDLKSWRAAMGNMTQTEAAKLLGYGRQHLSDMETGRQAIPEHLGHACAALWYGLEPWPDCAQDQ